MFVVFLAAGGGGRRRRREREMAGYRRCVSEREMGRGGKREGLILAITTENEEVEMEEDMGQFALVCQSRRQTDHPMQNYKKVKKRQ